MAPEAFRQEENLLLCGFDAVGLSAVVDRAGLEFGRRAGEYVAGAIEPAVTAVASALSAANFRLLEHTGDGAVWYQSGANPWPARQLDDLCARIRNVHRDASGIAVRASWAAGTVRSTHLPVSLTEQASFRWGEGLARLHGRVSNQRSRWPRSAVPRFAPVGTGVIAEDETVFLRIAGPADWPRLTTATLFKSLELIEGWSSVREGRMHRLTHDDKGIQLRLSLPLAAAAARHDVEELLAVLRTLGLSPAAAACAGSIFYGPGLAIHGAAINRAAKQCAQLAPGGLSGFADKDRRTVRPSLPMVGRSDELDLARNWLADAGTRLLVLTGEPGIGKTHLLRELAARLQEEGPVALAVCRFSDNATPFGIVAALAHVLLPQDCDGTAPVERMIEEAGLDRRAIALVAPLLGQSAGAAIEPSVPATERAALIRKTFVAMLTQAADTKPVTLCIDDAHLCDEESLRTLEDLLGQKSERIRLLLAARDEGELPVVARTRQSAVLQLRGLGDAEIGTIAHSLSSQIDAAEVAALALGNPLRAIQLVLARAEQDGLGFRDGLVRRITSQSDEAVQLLQLAALAERPLPVGAIAGILSLPLNRVEQTVTFLVGQRLLRTSLVTEGVEPAHQIIAEEIAGTLPDGARRRMAVLLARHAARANQPWSLAARGRLWMLADKPQRAEATFARSARAALAAGSFSAAARLFGEAAQIGDERGSGRVADWRAERASALWAMGEIRSANSEARAALRSVARTSRKRRAPARVAAAAVRAETGYFLGDLGEMVAGNWAVFRGTRDRSESKVALGRGYSSLTYLAGLWHADRLSRMCARQGIALSERSGDGRPAAYNHTALAILCIVRGQWEAGETEIAAATEALRTRPEEHHLLEVIETVAGMGAHLRGDAAQALLRFEALRARAIARHHALHQLWASYAMAQTHLAAGAPELAWESLQPTLSLLDRLEDQHSHHICSGLASRIYLARGDTLSALEWAERSLVWSERLPSTNFTSLEAFSAAPLVAASLIAGGGADDRVRAIRRRGMRRLRTFARFFPIARPRFELVAAIDETDLGRQAQKFAHARARAHALRMDLELSLVERMSREAAER
jgi:hypothetical protein